MSNCTEIVRAASQTPFTTGQYTPIAFDTQKFNTMPEIVSTDLSTGVVSIYIPAYLVKRVFKFEFRYRVNSTESGKYRQTFLEASAVDSLTWPGIPGFIAKNSTDGGNGINHGYWDTYWIPSTAGTYRFRVPLYHDYVGALTLEYDLEAPRLTITLLP